MPFATRLETFLGGMEIAWTESTPQSVEALETFLGGMEMSMSRPAGTGGRAP